jgi:hypothetical protein
MGKVLAGEIPSTSFRFTQNFLSHPDDVTAAIACVELCREIGNSKPLQPFTRREVMPGNLKGAAFETFVRDGAESYFHETCTAKMGRDAMSVVNGNLKVYGSKIFASRTVRSCHACQPATPWLPASSSASAPANFCVPRTQTFTRDASSDPLLGHTSG